MNAGCGRGDGSEQDLSVHGDPGQGIAEGLEGAVPGLFASVTCGDSTRRPWKEVLGEQIWKCCPVRPSRGQRDRFHSGKAIPSLVSHTSVQGWGDSWEDGRTGGRTEG